MNNITLSKWIVVLFLASSSHRYTVRAVDCESALKEAIAAHNKERKATISSFDVQEFTLHRLKASA